MKKKKKELWRSGSPLIEWMGAQWGKADCGFLQLQETKLNLWSNSKIIHRLNWHWMNQNQKIRIRGRRVQTH